MSATTWAIMTPLVLIALLLLVGVLQALVKNKNVQNHPAIAIILQDALDIASSALALMQGNPSLSPQDAKAWAVKELKATMTPQSITSLGAAVSDEALGYLVNKKMVSVAVAAPVSDATKAIIATLAPSALTARVTPPQVAAVDAILSSEVPLTLSALLAEFPALVGIRKTPNTLSAATLHETTSDSPAQPGNPAPSPQVGA